MLWSENAVVEDIENAMLKRGILPDSEQWNELLEMWYAERKRKGLPY